MLLGTAATLFAAGAAWSQAGPAPGSADAKAVTRQNQETNAEFNRQVGAKDRKPGRGGKAVPATAADFVVGSPVRDRKGLAIGTIDGVEADGIVVTSAAGKVKVPTEAFGKDKGGLLLQISKAEFDAAVVAANSPAG